MVQPARGALHARRRGAARHIAAQLRDVLAQLRGLRAQPVLAPDVALLPPPHVVVRCRALLLHAARCSSERSQAELTDALDG
jgi:hypothetical protein